MIILDLVEETRLQKAGNVEVADGFNPCQNEAQELCIFVMERLQESPSVLNFRQAALG
ncbi:hypothetical protein GCM10017557_16940 [Streptomyces aurantiacus]|uniref:Uncharacterized protein n=1 Tax=Streptomyces aurantiacus TaxID=47760 RepID=A0A7G1P196_9ACTN|nr:hypothetical protein GCM10017557_16940 [Streptomyces aurantiacus]